MSSSKTIAQVDDHTPHKVKSVNQWDRAIADARQIIEQSESKIREMKRAIRAFERMRDAGEPWPTSESDAKHSGQEGHLG